MERLNPYGLLAFSVLVSFLSGVFRNAFSKKNTPTRTDHCLFNFYSSIFTTLTLIVFSGGLTKPTAYAVLLGAVFGIITGLSAIAYLQALSIGPLSYTTVVVMAAMILPALSGAILWEQALSWQKYAGMVLMLACIVLSVDRKEGDKKASVRWLVMTLLSFFLTGVIGILQTVQQKSAHSEELATFLVSAFIADAILSGVMALCGAKGERNPKTASFHPKKRSLWLAVGCGICISFANQINLYLAGAMETAVFFPIVNGGVLLLTAAAGFLVFREKLTARQWVGIGIGTAAIGILCFF